MTIKGANQSKHPYNIFDNMVGERIRELRKEYGMTIDQFAEITDLSNKTISNYENGKNTITIPSLINIYKAFDSHFNDVNEVFIALVYPAYKETQENKKNKEEHPTDDIL